MENFDTITYLFGAGASKNALPIVNEIPDALYDFENDLAENQNILSDKSDSEFEKFRSLRDIQIELIEKLKIVREGASRHASIDTYAKKLYLTQKHTELWDLKAVMISFFNYLQMKNPVDKRYDSFFAAISSNAVFRFPQNLRILSWNYDFQFEKAYSEYLQDKNMFSNISILNIVPKDWFTKVSENQFAIFKINGNTTIYQDSRGQTSAFIPNVNSTFDIEFIELIVKSYGKIVKKNSETIPMLTFAWEKNNLAEETIKQAMLATKSTKILVVIGYSFPFFNREIDRKIINNMSLEKVYFQAPGKEAYNYIDRFGAIRTDISKQNLIPIEDVEQFFLPPEL